MIVLEFDIPKYDWKVKVYYYKTKYYTREITESLEQIGCDQECLKDARLNLEEDKLNSGLCFSNTREHKTIIVIAKTTSPDQFMNSWMHEAKHLLSHIELKFNIDPYSELAAYLCGYIALKMFPYAKKFLCNCYSK